MGVRGYGGQTWGVAVATFGDKVATLGDVGSFEWGYSG